MTTSLYNAGKVAFLRGVVDLVGDDIRLLPVRATYAPNFLTHVSLADVPVPTRAATGTPLAGALVTGTAGGRVTFDADDTTLSSMPSGAPVTGLVLYQHTGVEGTSRLIAYLDNHTNLPFTPDGGSVTVVWSDEVDRIFSI